MDEFAKFDWQEPQDYRELLNFLEAESEPAYAEFTKKGISSHYPIIGVRLPKLRKLARSITKSHYANFLAVCDQTYFETVLLRGLVTANIKDLDELVDYFWDYAALVDDWCLCDSFCNSLKIARRYPEKFLALIDALIQTKEEFKVRIGLVLLLCHFVEAPYLDRIIQYLREIKSEAYYVEMAEAWLVCEIFTKFPEVGERILQARFLNRFTQNKAISKIRDSYRVDRKTKDYLVQYRMK